MLGCIESRQEALPARHEGFGRLGDGDSTEQRGVVGGNRDGKGIPHVIPGP